MAGSLLLASPAAAAPSAPVVIRDLTPPLVSVDAGGTVTFTNQIADETVQVGGGGLLPTLVSVTAHTDVTLGLPSGSHGPQPGASVSETFGSTCASCSITYAHRLTSNVSVTSALTPAALNGLPALPVPTPFVVDTILPGRGHRAGRGVRGVVPGPLGLSPREGRPRDGAAGPARLVA